MCLVLISLVQAEVNLVGQVEEVYNFGDIINTNIKISSEVETSEVLFVNLVCGGEKTEVYKEFVLMSAGEEKEEEIKIPLMNSFIGTLKGNCFLEKQHLLTCGVGEGLLIMEDDHTKIKVKASSEEHKLITTNPNEKKEMEKAKVEVKRLEQKPTREVTINLDDSLGCFKFSQLSRDEIEFLLNKGYKITIQKSIMETKKEKYLIRPLTSESDKHFFVIHDLKNYLEKKGIKVQTFMTKKPDLVFNLHGKKVAIEVETGSMLSRPKVFREKVEELNKSYDGWFFVVTDPNKIKKYREFGRVIDLRYLKRQLKNTVGIA